MRSSPKSRAKGTAINLISRDIRLTLPDVADANRTMGDALKEAYIDEVLAKSLTLKKSGFWLPEPQVRPRAWLNNFASLDDKYLAALILDRLVFFSDRLVNSLLRSAFYSLTQQFTAIHGLGTMATRQAISKFIRTSVFTRVEGEKPNPTDSGNLFCRKARQHLGIPETQILEPAAALSAAANGYNVVFLDDFAGSGNQFVKTLNRVYSANNPKTFNQASTLGAPPYTYLCLTATPESISNIAAASPQTNIHACHIITDKYSVKNWGSSRISEIDDLLRRHSARLTSLEPYMQIRDYPIYGFAELGLTVAFEHSVPDASLPIIWASGPDWAPLVPRT